MTLNNCADAISCEKTSTDKLMDERSLIERIQNGEKDDFRHLVNNYKDLVFSMIMRQVGDHTLSEELAQEVFIKAFLNIKKFQFRSAFSTWLTRIALNHTNSFFTSKRNKIRNITDEFDMKKHESITKTNPDTEDKALEQEKLLLRFRQALSGLKDKFREVIVLCSLEGKSYEEASEILDIPLGTVRSRLNKARLLIKETIEN